jgi:hypothetical protein
LAISYTCQKTTKQHPKFRKNSEYLSMQPIEWQVSLAECVEILKNE